MITEDERSQGLSKDTRAGMSRTESVFHSKWLAIKGKEKDLATADEELLKILEKSNKAKAQTLSDKVNSANIKEWKEQKWLPCAFFENFKNHFLDQGLKQFTYGEYENFDQTLPPFAANVEEGDLNYVNSSPEVKKRVDEYSLCIQAQYLSRGLTDEEVKLRRDKDGPNKLPEKKTTPEIIKFLMEITNVFALLLWVASILCFIGYGLATYDMANLWLAIFIIMIIFVTGIFSWYQNGKSEKIMNSFKSFTISQVSVIRNGREMKISAVDLVRGDVVKVNIGEKVPADIRIFTANDLQVDNSPLTGETIPVKISSVCGEKGRENPLEATNICFFSTLCKNGSGVGVVIQTGVNTFMGRIADLASSAGPEISNLQKEINFFIKVIATIAVSFGVLFFILGFIIKYPVITNFVFAIGIVVANVPEGLITVVTISLAITATKMLKRNVMVKNLQSVETLGSITVICSDKTGTLTQNKMTVVHLWYDRELKKVKREQEDITVDGAKIKMSLFDPNEASFPIFQFAAVCGSKGNFLQETPEDFIPVIQGRNKFIDAHPRATYEQIQEEISRLKKQFQEQYNVEYESNIDERITDTDASETGILKFFEKIEKIDSIREKFPQHINPHNNKAVLIPFNSTLKFTCFIRKAYEDNGKQTFWLAIKGAPDYIIKRCSKYLMNGKEYKMDDGFKEDFEKANKSFALKGERVIGMAYTKLDSTKFTPDFKFLNHPQEEFDPEYKYEVPDPNYPITDLCFVGLVAMEDPPRPGVKEAIAQCNTAGIKVIMVTGDQPLTAASIAYQIGIIKDLDDTPEIIMEREGLKSLEEAEKKSNTIIITGDRLYRSMKEDEALSDDNPKKGAFLRNWLMKRDVVFARTSPEQKLIIVDGCQKLSHVVAVTGDGVNDSPAIKKADIGIAMGKVGTDVAKDAADIVLLDDNFPNIIRGIKQGRRIFETIKKIIGYTLTSNISELVPFLGFVIFQFPLPFTTIMVLIIDVGTDVYPDISFSYEPAESGIMDKNPRNSKRDKICTLRLFGWAYMFMGTMQTSGSFIMYWVAFNSYGFYPSNLFYIVQEEGIIPSRNDVYNPYDDMYKGNSPAFIYSFADVLEIHGESQDLFVESVRRGLDYTADIDTWIDFRLFKYEWNEEDFSKCKYDDRGVDYDGPVCYHMIEALRHAQSANLLGVVLLQISNGILFRTIQLSIFKHLFTNVQLNLAYFFEAALISLLLYCPGLNTGLQLRGLRFHHWIPCLGVWIFMICYSEFTKLLIRNVKNPDGTVGFFYKYLYY